MVALGGLLGASARYGVGLLLPHMAGTFPLGTLLINVVGGFLIGVLIDAVAERPLLRPFAVTGILGGFTTFSTFSVQIVLETDGGRPGKAAGYLAASVVGGVAAAALGYWLGRRLA